VYVTDVTAKKLQGRLLVCHFRNWHIRHPQHF